MFGRVIERYLHLIKSDQFAKYEKEFAYRIQRGLYKGYIKGLYEPKMVMIVKNIIDELDDLQRSVDGISISTKSIFIHGYKSQVEFEYYGRKKQRELGDLIFILSVVYRGKKYFERFTISQFKKSGDKLRWNMSNKEQLYLLSRFPTFRGVKGSIIPVENFNLPNFSKCLGSFNLLFPPGDFIFTSAVPLEIIVGHRKSISMSYLLKLWKYFYPHLYYPELIDLEFIEKLPYIWFKIHRPGLHYICFPLLYCIDIIGNSLYAPNIHDFVDKYLRGCIGEQVYSYIGIYNRSALNFLCKLLSAILQKAQNEGKTHLRDFVERFFKYPYGEDERGIREDTEFNDRGGGIGIIHTLINLGE